jgi:RNA polymerase sigma-70 factor, ECF subfamily
MVHWSMSANPSHRTADPATSADVTILLGQMVQGDPQAASRLVPLVYGELRQMAARYMRRERVDHTLQTTALVHEAYLKLVEQTPASWQNRAHFFAVAAQVMRHILIDHARGHLREKRGGGQAVLQLDEGLVFSPEQSSELLEVDAALHRLSELDPRQGKIVELRFFGGLTVEETAAALGVSPKTVKRDWSVAKAWLHGELKQNHGNIVGAMGGR